MNGRQEMCYLPTWPAGFPRMGKGRGPPPDRDGPHPERLTDFDFKTVITERLAEEVWNIVRPGPDDWIRPQPRCVRRVYPYGM